MAPSTRNMEEQAKVNAANAKITKMNQAKTKMSNLQIKLECAIGQLRGTFMDYEEAKDDEDVKQERDIAIVVIQNKWNKMETIAKELNETMEGLSEIVSTSKEGDEISEDPSTIIAASNREAKEAYKEYLEFKEKHIKDIKEIKKIRVEIGNSSS